MRRTTLSILTLAALAAALAASTGCNDGGGKPGASQPSAGAGGGSRAPREAIPATVALADTRMTSGFARGVLREQVDVAAFEITRHPITRAQYDECVEAGACRKAKGDRCDVMAREPMLGRKLDAPESPKTCLAVTQARDYCSWIGGRLPTLPEWLVAARGPTPRRFAWGDSAPSCEQHVRSNDLPGAYRSQQDAEAAGCVPPEHASIVVNEHPSGAAPSGMEDVLLTPGELLGPQARAQFSACSDGFAGCSVYGSAPGAIDAVYPIEGERAQHDAALIPHVYGFRCVLESK